MDLLFKIFSIVVIDLILGGDNAVVIALAVRGLPKEQRGRVIAFGAGAAVALRVVLTFFAAQLLELQYVKLIGGLLILWIAVKLFTGDEDEAAGAKALSGFWRAIGYIVVADLTMSLDNVLAVAAASHGNLILLIFGLGLSIPLVVGTSTLLSRLMDRFPAIVYIGAAILGKVGAEMILTDGWIKKFWAPSALVVHLLEGVAAVAVVLAGLALTRRASRKAAA